MLRTISRFAGPLAGKGTPLGELKNSVNSFTAPPTMSNEEIHADLQKLANDVYTWITGDPQVGLGCNEYGRM